MKRIIAALLSIFIIGCYSSAVAEREYYLNLIFSTYSEQYLKNNFYSEGMREVILSIVHEASTIKARIIQTISDNTQLSKDDINTKTDETLELMTVIYILELMDQGSKISDSEANAFQIELSSLNIQLAEIQDMLRSGKGKTPQAEWNSLIQQKYNAEKRAADITYLLDGTSISVPVIKLVRQRLAVSRGKASAYLLDIGYAKGSTIDQEILDQLTNDFYLLSELTAELQILLQKKT